MANSNFNYLKKDAVNWLPLSFLNRNDERWTDGADYQSDEPTANFGGGSIEGYGSKIMYAFGLGAPEDSRPLYYSNDDWATVQSEGSNVIAENNWGQYDMLGIKRAHNGVVDPNSELDTQPLENEAGVFINTKYELKVWLFYGTTFNGGVQSTDSSTENVGYWAEYTTLPAGASATIPWINDDHGFQSERMYFEYVIPVSSNLFLKTDAQLLEIEELGLSKGLTGEAIANGYTQDDIYGLMVIPAFGPIKVDGTPGDDSLDTDVLLINTGDDEVDATYGPISSDYIDSMDITEFLASNAEGDEITSVTVTGKVGRSYILLGNPAKSVVSVSHSYDTESDTTTFTFNVPAHNEGDSMILYFNVNVTGVLSGFVEGSFISGATVTGYTTDGTQVTATTNENGYYEFDEEVVGEITATGGENLMTGDSFEEGVEGSSVEERVGNSDLGGTISPLSTMVVDLMKLEGLNKEEAIDAIVESSDILEMDAAVADKAKIKIYLRVGVSGLQKGGTDRVAEYAGFLKANKAISEQSTGFVEENIDSSVDRKKKRKALRKFKRQLARFVSKKKKGLANEYLNEYKAKAGADAHADTINANTMGKKDKLYLVMASAVEDAFEDLDVNDLIATDKSDWKSKAREIVEEAADNAIEVVATTYEDIAIEVNKKAKKRKSARKKKAKKRYKGEEATLANELLGENFDIVKTETGYQYSGTVTTDVKKGGNFVEEAEEVAGTTDYAFLEDSNVANYSSKIKKGNSTVIIEDNTSGRVEEKEEEEVLPINNAYRIVSNSRIILSSSTEQYIPKYDISGGSNIKQPGVDSRGEETRYNFYILDLLNGRILYVDRAAWEEGSEYRGILADFVAIGEANEEVSRLRIYHLLRELNAEMLEADNSGEEEEREAQERIAKHQADVKATIEDRDAEMKSLYSEFKAEQEKASEEIENGDALLYFPFSIAGRISTDVWFGNATFNSYGQFIEGVVVQLQENVADLEDELNALNKEIAKLESDGFNNTYQKYYLDYTENKLAETKDVLATINDAPEQWVRVYEIEEPNVSTTEDVEKAAKIAESTRDQVLEMTEDVEKVGKKYQLDVSVYVKLLASLVDSIISWSNELDEIAEEIRQEELEREAKARIEEFVAEDKANLASITKEYTDVVDKYKGVEEEEDAEMEAGDRLFISTFIIGAPAGTLTAIATVDNDIIGVGRNSYAGYAEWLVTLDEIIDQLNEEVDGLEAKVASIEKEGGNTTFETYVLAHKKSLRKAALDIQDAANDSAENFDVPTYSNEVEIPEMTNMDELEKVRDMVNSEIANSEDQRSHVEAIGKKHGIDVAELSEILTELIDVLKKENKSIDELEAKLSGEQEVYEYNVNEAQKNKEGAQILDTLVAKADARRAADIKAMESGEISVLYPEEQIVTKIASGTLANLMGHMEINALSANNVIAAFEFKAQWFESIERLRKETDEIEVKKAEKEKEGLHTKVEDLQLERNANYLKYMENILQNFGNSVPNTDVTIDFKSLSSSDLESLLEILTKEQKEREDDVKQADELDRKFGEQFESPELIKAADSALDSVKSVKEDVSNILVETEIAEFEKANDLLNVFAKETFAGTEQFDVTQKEIDSLEAEKADMEAELKDREAEFEKASANIKEQIANEHAKYKAENEEATKQHEEEVTKLKEVIENTSGEEEVADLKAKLEAIEEEFNVGRAEAKDNLMSTIDKLETEAKELEDEHYNLVDELKDKIVQITTQIDELKAKLEAELDKFLSEADEEFAGLFKSAISEASDVEKYRTFATAGDAHEYLNAAIDWDKWSVVEEFISEYGAPNFKEPSTAADRNKFEGVINMAISSRRNDGNAIALFTYGGGFNGYNMGENTFSELETLFPTKALEWKNTVEGYLPINTAWGLTTSPILSIIIQMYTDQENYRTYVDKIDSAKSEFENVKSDYFRAIHRAGVIPSIDRVNDTENVERYIANNEELLQTVFDSGVTSAEYNYAAERYNAANEKAEANLSEFWNNWEPISMHDGKTLDHLLDRIQESIAEANQATDDLRRDVPSEEIESLKEDVYGRMDSMSDMIREFGDVARAVDHEFEADLERWGATWDEKLDRYSSDQESYEKEIESYRKVMDKEESDIASIEKDKAQYEEDFHEMIDKQSEEFDAKFDAMEKDGASEEEVAEFKEYVQNVNADNKATFQAQMDEYESDIANSHKAIMEAKEEVNLLEDKISESDRDRKEAEDVLKRIKAFERGAWLEEPMEYWMSYHERAREAFGPVIGIWLDSLRDLSTPKIEDAKANIKDIESVLATIEAENSDAIAQFKKDAQSAEDSFQKEIDELKKSADEIAAAHKEDVSNTTAKHEATIAEYKKSLDSATTDEEIAELKAVIEDEEVAFKEWYAKAEESYNASISENKAEQEDVTSKYYDSRDEADNKESEREAEYQDQRAALLTDKSDFEVLVADESQKLDDEMTHKIDAYRSWSENYASIKDDFKNFYMKFYQYRYNNLSDKGEMLHQLVDKTFNLVGNVIILGSDAERYNELSNQISKLEEQANDDVTPEDRENMLQKVDDIKRELENLLSEANENFERNKFTSPEHGMSEIFKSGGGYLGNQNGFEARELDSDRGEDDVRNFNRIYHMYLENEQVFMTKNFAYVNGKVVSGIEAYFTYISNGTRDNAMRNLDDFQSELASYRHSIYYRAKYTCRGADEIARIDDDKRNAKDEVETMQARVAKYEKEEAAAEERDFNKLPLNQSRFYLDVLVDYSQQVDNCYSDKLNEPRFEDIEREFDQADEMLREQQDRFRHEREKLQQQVEEAAKRAAEAEMNLQQLMDEGAPEEAIEKAKAEFAQYNEEFKRAEDDLAGMEQDGIRNLIDNRNDAIIQIEEMIIETRNNTLDYINSKRTEGEADLESARAAIEFSNEMLNDFEKSIEKQHDRLAKTEEDKSLSEKEHADYLESQYAQHEKQAAEMKAKFAAETDKLKADQEVQFEEMITEQESQIAELKKAIASAPEEEVADLKAKLEAVQTDHDSKREELEVEQKAERVRLDEDQKATSEAFEAEFKTMISETEEEHRNHMDNVENEIAEMHKQISQLEDNISQEKERKSERESKLAEVEDFNKEFESFVTRTSELFHEFFNQLHDLARMWMEMSRDDAASNLDDKYQTISNIDAEIDERRKHLDSLKKERAVTEEDRAKTNEEQDKTMSELEKAKVDLEDYQSSKESSLKDLKSLDTSLEENEAEREEATAQHEEEVASLKKAIESAPEEEVANLKAKLEAIESEFKARLDKMYTEEAELKKSIEFENKRLAEYSKLIDETQALVAEKEDMLSKLAEDLKQLSSQINDLQDSTAKVEDQLSEAQANKADEETSFEDSLQSFEESFDNLRNTYKDLVARIEDEFRNEATKYLETKTENAEGLQELISWTKYSFQGMVMEVALSMPSKDEVSEKMENGDTQFFETFRNEAEAVKENLNQDWERFDNPAHLVKRAADIGGGYIGEDNGFGKRYSLEESGWRNLSHWSYIVFRSFNAIFALMQAPLAVQLPGRLVTNSWETFILDGNRGSFDENASMYRAKAEKLVADYKSSVTFIDSYNCKDTSYITETERDMKNGLEQVNDLNQLIEEIKKTGEGNLDQAEFDYVAWSVYSKQTTACYNENLVEPRFENIEREFDQADEMLRHAEDEFRDEREKLQQQVEEAAKRAAEAEMNLQQLMDEGAPEEVIEKAKADFAYYDEEFKRAEDDLDNMTKSYIEDSMMRRADAIHEISERISETKNYIAEFVDNKTSEFKDVKNSQEAEFAGLEEQLASIEESIEKQHDKIAKTEEDKSLSEKEHADYLESQYAQHEKQAAEMKAKFAAETDKLKADQEVQFEEMITEQESQIAELKKAIASAPEEEVADLKAKLEAVQTDHDSKREELEVEQKAERVKVDEDHKASIDAFEAEFKTMISETEKEHRDHMDNVENEIAEMHKQVADLEDQNREIKDRLSRVDEELTITSDNSMQMSDFSSQTTKMFLEFFEQLHDLARMWMEMSRDDAASNLHDAHQTISDLESEKKEIEKVLEDLTQQLEERHDTNAKTEDEVSQSHEELSHAKEVADVSEEEKAAREDKLKSLEVNVAETEKSITSTKENIKVESTELDKAKAENEEATAEKAEKEDKLKSLEANVAETEKSIASTKENIKVESTELDKAKDDESTYTKDKADKQATVKSYQDSLTETQATRDAHVKEHEEYIAKTKKAIEEAEAEGNEELVADYKASLSDTETSHTEYLAKADATIEDLSVSITSLNTEIDELSEELDVVKTTIAEKEDKISSLEEELSKLESVLADRQKSIADEKTQIKDLDVTIDEKTTTIAEKEDKIAQLEEELSELESVLADRQKSIANEKMQIKELDEQIDVSKTTIAEKEDNIASLSEDLKKLKSEIAELEDRRNKAENDLDQNRNNEADEKASFENNLNDFESRFEDIARAYDDLRNRIKDEFMGANQTFFHNKTDDSETLMQIINHTGDMFKAMVQQRAISLPNRNELAKEMENGNYEMYDSVRDKAQSLKEDMDQAWNDAAANEHLVRIAFEIGGGYKGSVNGFPISTGIEEWNSLSRWSYILFREFDAIFANISSRLAIMLPGRLVTNAWEVYAYTAEEPMFAEEIDKANAVAEHLLNTYKNAVYYFDSYPNEGIEGLPKLDDEISKREDEFDVLTAQYNKAKEDGDDEPDGDGGNDGGGDPDGGNDGGNNGGNDGGNNGGGDPQWWNSGTNQFPFPQSEVDSMIESWKAEKGQTTPFKARVKNILSPINSERAQWGNNDHSAFYMRWFKRHWNLKLNEGGTSTENYMLGEEAIVKIVQGYYEHFDDNGNRTSQGAINGQGVIHKITPQEWAQTGDSQWIQIGPSSTIRANQEIEIEIWGQLPTDLFTSNQQHIEVEVLQWGDYPQKLMYGFAYGLTSKKDVNTGANIDRPRKWISATDLPNLSECVLMSAPVYGFEYYEKLSEWDVSKVKNFVSLFLQYNLWGDLAHGNDHNSSMEFGIAPPSDKIDDLTNWKPDNVLSMKMTYPFGHVVTQDMLDKQLGSWEFPKLDMTDDLFYQCTFTGEISDISISDTPQTMHEDYVRQGWRSLESGQQRTEYFRDIPSAYNASVGCLNGIYAGWNEEYFDLGGFEPVFGETTMSELVGGCNQSDSGVEADFEKFESGLDMVNTVLQFRNDNAEGDAYVGLMRENHRKISERVYEYIYSLVDENGSLKIDGCTEPGNINSIFNGLGTVNIARGYFESLSSGPGDLNHRKSILMEVYAVCRLTDGSAINDGNGGYKALTIWWEETHENNYNGYFGEDNSNYPFNLSDDFTTEAANHRHFTLDMRNGEWLMQTSAGWGGSYSDETQPMRSTTFGAETNERRHAIAISKTSFINDPEWWNRARIEHISLDNWNAASGVDVTADFEISTGQAVDAWGGTHEVYTYTRVKGELQGNSQYLLIINAPQQS